VSLAEWEHEPNSAEPPWMMLIMLKLDIIPSDSEDLLEPEQHKHGSNKHELKHDAGGAACPVLWCLCFAFL
jgi:hypothetical protein